MNPADQSGSSPADRKPARHPLDWLAQTGTSGMFLQELEARRQRRGRRRGMLAGAGGIAVLVVMAGVFWPGAERRADASSSPASATVVSVPARQVLPDGSVVELRDDAELVEYYSDQARRVALKRGEAHFQVASNDAIPFVVTVGTVEIRAVGTAFTVRAAPAAIQVLVTEGRVAVQKGEGRSEPGASDRILPPSVAPTLVDAGNRLVLETAPQPGAPVDPQVMPVSPAEIDERLAWRVPRIEFSGTPLAEAILVFNRHSRVRVMLGNAELERLQLSGILRADNVDALVRLLEANYGVMAERREDGIVLRKVTAAPKPD